MMISRLFFPARTHLMQLDALHGIAAMTNNVGSLISM